MSKRDDLILLEDIFECVEKINKYVLNLDLPAFLSGEKTQDAVARNFEIIGEAAPRLSEVFRNTNSQINWRLLKDFRDKLIHVYEIIDYTIVWSAIQNELSASRLQIKTIIDTKSS